VHGREGRAKHNLHIFARARFFLKGKENFSVLRLKFLQDFRAEAKPNFGKKFELGCKYAPRKQRLIGVVF